MTVQYSNNKNLLSIYIYIKRKWKLQITNITIYIRCKEPHQLLKILIFSQDSGFSNSWGFKACLREVVDLLWKPITLLLRKR